jgi:hypothetical protein
VKSAVALISMGSSNQKALLHSARRPYQGRRLFVLQVILLYLFDLMKPLYNAFLVVSSHFWKVFELF